MKAFLLSRSWIDWETPSVLDQARCLAEGLRDEDATARCCFAFVRDESRHRWDHRCGPVTCRASDTLFRTLPDLTVLPHIDRICRPDGAARKN